MAERVAGIQPFFDEHPDALLPVTRQIFESGRNCDAVRTFQAMYQLQSLRHAAAEQSARMDVLLLPTAGTIYTHRGSPGRPDPAQLEPGEVHQLRQPARPRRGRRPRRVPSKWPAVRRHFGRPRGDRPPTPEAGRSIPRATEGPAGRAEAAALTPRRRLGPNHPAAALPPPSTHRQSGPWRAKPCNGVFSRSSTDHDTAKNRAIPSHGPAAGVPRRPLWRAFLGSFRRVPAAGRGAGTGSRTTRLGLLILPLLDPADSHRARLVRRLPRIGVEDGVGQPVGRLVVHRHEDLPRLHASA